MGTGWALGQVGVRPCLLAGSPGPGSRWLCAQRSVPETQCPKGGPLRFWFPDDPQSLLATSLGLASGWWASHGPRELFPAAREARPLCERTSPLVRGETLHCAVFPAFAFPLLSSALLGLGRRWGLTPHVLSRVWNPTSSSDEIPWQEVARVHEKTGPTWHSPHTSGNHCSVTSDTRF